MKLNKHIKEIIMKEETLEEAEKEFEKLINGKGLPTKQLLEVAEHYFIVGYEIAKERSYSEKEVLEFLKEVRKGSMITSSTNNRTYWDFDIKSEKKWFEQFKKK